MTPDEYIDELGALVAGGSDQEALEFARTAGPGVRPPLTGEQFSHVWGMLEGAAMSVNLTEAAAHGTAKVARVRVVRAS